MVSALITGAGGFIGSHVVEAFLAAGHRVRALVRYTSTGTRGWLDFSEAARRAERSGQLDIALGDVTDPHHMIDLAERQEVIVHLAALIGIPHSYVAPTSYEAVNVRGTVNILEAARRQGARRVIVTSTSEVYGTARTTPITEEHPLQGQSPYAASKIAADMLAASHHCAFDLPVVTLRPFNTYGPRQSLRAIVPTVMAQALAGAEEIRLGNLEPRRDLTFVEDTARAFALAAEREGLEGETIHFGSGEAHTVAEIAQRCLEAVGSQARIVSDPGRVRPAKSEVGELLCDAAKAKRLLGWKPRVSLDEGLRRTAEHLRRWSNPARAEDYTR